MAANNRDFIDFLIELFAHRKKLYLFLFFLLIYTTYFNLVKNDRYEYVTTIKVSPESILVPIINNINVYNTSADVFLNPLKINVSYQSLKEDLCDLINATFVDENFYYRLADDYQTKNPSDVPREKVFANLKSAIERKASTTKVCVNVKISSTYDYIVYLKKYYQSMINMYLQNEISKRLALIKSGKIDFLQESLNSTKTSAVTPLREVTLGQLELNALEERQVVVLSKLELVKNTQIVNTNIGYIIYNTSDIGKTLNYIFLYAFAVFMSLIFFILTVVVIDFRTQFNSRQPTEN